MGVRHPINGLVMRFDREAVHPLGREQQGPSLNFGTEAGEQPVIMAAPTAEALSFLVECKSGHEDPVDLARFDEAKSPARFWDSATAGDEIARGVEDLGQAEQTKATVDDRQDQALLGIQNMPEERPGLDLFGEGGGVKQDCTGLCKPREGFEPFFQSSLLTQTHAGVKGEGPGDDLSPDLGLARPSSHGEATPPRRKPRARVHLR